MRTCAKCKKELEETNFSKKTERNGKIVLQSYCKKCNGESKKEWYSKDKNKAKTILDAGNRKKDLALFVLEIKNNSFCKECGENHISTLDFHHRDSSEKDFDISLMAGLGKSKKLILEEIEKCDVLCSNCHRKLHYNIKNGNID